MYAAVDERGGAIRPDEQRFPPGDSSSRPAHWFRGDRTRVFSANTRSRSPKTSVEYDGLVKRDRLKPGFARAATLCLALAATARLGASASNPCLPLPVIERAAAPAEQPPKDMLTIASLNMAGQPRIADALAAWTELRGIDVLLLQEVGPTVSDGEKFVLAMSARLGFNVVFAPAYSPQTYHQGLAIMSRYPLHDVHVDLLPYHHLHFRWRCRNVLAVTVVTTAGSIRMVDVHLDTRINSRDRVAQLTPVVDSLKQTDGPQIVGGDFNTANIGWLDSTWPFPWAQHQPAAVRAVMAMAGFETPFGKSSPTFKLLGLPLKLDWIFLKGLSSFDWSVDDVRYSDHRGIWAHVKTRAVAP